MRSLILFQEIKTPHFRIVTLYMPTIEVLNIALVAQGILMSFFFLGMKGARWSNAYLFAVFGLQSANFGLALLKSNHVWVHAPYLLDVNLVTIPIVRILVYFYALRLVGKPIGYGWQMWVHWLIPLTYFLFFTGYDVLFTPPERMLEMAQQYGRAGERTSRYLFFNVSYLFVFIGYTIASIFQLHVYLKAARDCFSDARRFHAKWVYDLLWIKLVAFLVFLCLIAVLQRPVLMQINTAIFMIPAILYVMWRNITKPIMVMPLSLAPQTLQAEIRNNGSDGSTLEVASQSVPSLPSETRQPSREAEFARILQALETEEVFRDVDLTVSKLADKLSLRAYVVSQAINREAGKSFFEFVNQYRVEAAKVQLLDSSMQHLSIEAIAETCGFSSRTAFYEAFKRHTGLTPARFRKQGVA